MEKNREAHALSLVDLADVAPFCLGVDKKKKTKNVKKYDANQGIQTHVKPN